MPTFFQGYDDIVYLLRMPFYIFAWIASFSSALIIVISKLTSKHAISNPWLFNFLWTLVIVLITLPPSLANHAGMPKNWLPLVFAAFFATLWNIFYILAIYRLDISTLSPLFNFRTVFAVVLGILFLGERLSSFQILLFAVITVAGVFATVDERMSPRSFWKPAIMIGLLAMLFLALNNVAIKMVLAHDDIWTANIWITFLNVIFLIPTLPLFYKELPKIKIHQVIPVTAMGLFQTITNFTAGIAYGVNVGITSLIMAAPLSMIIGFLFSLFAPQMLEKHTIKVYAIRFGAAVVMIYGALKLSM